MSEPTLDLTETAVEPFPGRIVCKNHFIRASISHTGGDVYPYADLCPWCCVERAESALTEAHDALHTIRAIMCDRELCGHFLPAEIEEVIVKVIGEDPLRRAARAARGGGDE